MCSLLPWRVPSPPPPPPSSDRARRSRVDLTSPGLEQGWANIDNFVKRKVWKPGCHKGLRGKRWSQESSLNHIRIDNLCSAGHNDLEVGRENLPRGSVGHEQNISAIAGEREREGERGRAAARGQEKNCEWRWERRRRNGNGKGRARNDRRRVW